MLFIQLWKKLRPIRRLQFCLVLILMVISSFAEVISLSALLPFLTILQDKNRVINQKFFLYIENLMPIVGENKLLALSLFFVVAILIAGSIKILLLYLITKVSFLAGSDISYDVYRRTLYQPFKVHINRNSSEIIDGIINKSNGVIHYAIMPMLIFINSCILAAAIFSYLISINPYLAILTIFIFGLIYGLVMFYVKISLIKNSVLISKNSINVVQSIQEGLGGIRDVILENLQEVYCKSYRSYDLALRKAQGQNQFFIQGPKFLIETIGLILLIGMGFFLSIKGGGVSDYIPLIGVVALGSQKLLPCMQQGYSAWSTMEGNRDSLKDVMTLMKQEIRQTQAGHAISFDSELLIQGVSFSHHANAKNTLTDINLSIKKGEKIGIVGPSGSGKSTLLDLIMGLIEPNIGFIKVDNVTLNQLNISSWRRKIAHVPQSIYLTDATIAENIAFGVNFDEIDQDKLDDCARRSSLSDLIGGWEDKFSTIIGERGARLSGGQRQRIGLARALYKGADVLILDESTSALDGITEMQIIDSIHDSNKNVTVIMVAHRLASLSKCSRIIEIKDGKISIDSSYDEFIKNSTFITD